MGLSRDQILRSHDIAKSTIELDVPEWGGKVNVRPMSGTDRERFEQAFAKNPGFTVRARIVVASVVDDSGHPVFTEEDIPGLAALSAKPIERVSDAAMKISAVGKEEVKALEKNS